ncbi:hypothetical protein [Modestobacter lapidis]|nr:hypothetical protein [Modestobacter lapidis]
MNEITVAGMTPSRMFDLLTTEGLSAIEAKTAIGRWIIDDVGGGQRIFRFSVDFPATDAADTSRFVRTFEHDDWRDGVDVVQAEGIEGFNRRFDAIRGDLDALGDELRRAYAGIAGLRAGLAHLLADVTAEFNRVNADLARLAERPQRPGRLEPFPGVLEMPELIGATTFFGKDVLAVRTATGIQVLPQVEIPRDRLGAGRLRYAGALGRAVANDAALGTALSAGTMTKEDLVGRFGDLVTEEGVTLREIVEVLPAGQVIGSPEALQDMVAERQAAVLRTTGGADAVLAASVRGSIRTRPESATTLGVEQLEGLPAETRTALLAAGITNVGMLADATAEGLGETLRAQGLQIDTGTAARWTGLARTLRGLG